MLNHDKSAPDADNGSVAAAVRDLYERHPYPCPVDKLDQNRSRADDVPARLAEHHLFWPATAFRENRTVLVAGCGTVQAARHAMRWPHARIVGIDVSTESLRRTKALKDKHSLGNLELRELPVEQAVKLGRQFDHIICTGVLHHLPDPDAGLRALRDALAPGGAMHLMVYAPYGRAGIYMLQDYCRRLGIGTSSAEIRDLATMLEKLPRGHPLWLLLRDSPDFRYEAGLADALLHPQDRPYSVPQFLELVARSGLGFGRWMRQAPYLPHCGAPKNAPHRSRLARLAAQEQYAAMELFRGTMVRHSAVVYRDAETAKRHAIRFDGDEWLDYRPIRLPETICVEERLPPNAAGVLINQRHTDTDIYLTVDSSEKRLFASIDGKRSIRELIAQQTTLRAARTFFERLWWHDQVVFDASRNETSMDEE